MVFFRTFHPIKLKLKKERTSRFMRKITQRLLIVLTLAIMALSAALSTSLPSIPTVEAGGNDCGVVRSACWDWGVIVEATCEATGGSNCQQEGIVAYGSCVTSNGCPIND